MTSPHLTQAIRDAVENGFVPAKNFDYISGVNSRVLLYTLLSGELRKKPISEILMHPAFWSALGKARGWGIEPSGSIWQGKPQFHIYWHDFIDHLISGGDVEGFFKSISTNN